MKKFTFKVHRPTGRYRSFSNSYTDIKFKGNVCGSIAKKDIKDTYVYKVKFQIIKDDINSDGNPNCIWRWITLAKEFSTEDQAREWVNKILTQLYYN
jgi:hypothetical protein